MVKRERWPQHLLVGLLVVAVGAFLTTALEYSGCVREFLGAETKKDALEFLGAIMGGILVALSVVVAQRRAKAMEDAAVAQAEGMKQQARANELTEQGQREERLKIAVDHLGSDLPVQRFAAAHELVHLAKDTEDLRHSILAILCENIRQTTARDDYRNRHATEPSTEIQGLLTLVLVREYAAFRGCRADLEKCWLNGADLRGARLPKANLRGARLEGTRLSDARLEGAVLVEARLRGARLQRACLRECDLTEAQMQAAKLTEARLQGATILAGGLEVAYLPGAQLQGADLREARLHGATLSGAQMQASRMQGTSLQGAILGATSLQGAGNPPWSSGSSFAERVRSGAEQEDRLSGDDRCAVFCGGVNEQRAEQLAGTLPSEDAKMVFWEQVKEHLDRPRSWKAPGGALLGTYSKVDAEAWIARHRQEMSDSG